MNSSTGSTLVRPVSASNSSLLSQSDFDDRKLSGDASLDDFSDFTDNATKKILLRKRNSRQNSSSPSVSNTSSRSTSQFRQGPVQKFQPTYCKIIESLLLSATAAIALYQNRAVVAQSHTFLLYYSVAFSLLTAYSWKHLVFPNFLYQVLFPPLVALTTSPDQFEFNLVLSLATFPMVRIDAIICLVAWLVPGQANTIELFQMIYSIGASLVDNSLSVTEVYLFSALLLNLLLNTASVPALYLQTFLFGSLFALRLVWFWVEKIMNLSRPANKSQKRRPSNATEMQLRYALFILIGYLTFVFTLAPAYLSSSLQTILPDTNSNPFILLVKILFIENAALHFTIIGYWGICLTLAILFIQSNSLKWTIDVRRKAWHATVVIMFLPVGVIMDPVFTKLVMAIALTAFLLVEFVRVTTIPPFGLLVQEYILRFIDERDTCGPIVVSHIFLILGISIPIFLASSPAGVVCLGLGDAMASTMGKKFGRHRWPQSSKTLEGSFAFVGSVVVGLLVYRQLATFYNVEFGFPVVSIGSLAAENSSSNYRWSLPQIILVATATSLLEAVGGMNDNVIVPIYMMVLLQLC